MKKPHRSSYKAEIVSSKKFFEINSLIHFVKLRLSLSDDQYLRDAARDMANVAYTAAKLAARIARAKRAHDDILAAGYRAQADADQFLRDAATRIRLRMSRTAQDIIEIGRDLIAVKERLGRRSRHDTGREGFGAWIDRECGMSWTTAGRFISAARRFGDDCELPSNLTQTVILELAAPSTTPEVRTEVIERAAAGERVM